MASTEEIILNLLAEPLKDKGYELIDVVFNRLGSEQTVQLFIDSSHGVGMEDCVTVSQVAQVVLENEDPIYETYNLEVSSPGIFRKLKTPEHFKNFAGKRIKVRLQQKLLGVKNAVGILEMCTEKEIRLKLESDGTELDIPFSMITKANLEPLLDF